MNESEDQTPEIQVYEDKVEELRQCLEKKDNFMGTKLELLKYQNFWVPTTWVKSVLHYQEHFQARDSDIVLASVPKTDTTWLKSLLFSIVYRKNPDHQPLNKKSPLLTHNPHELVYFLDAGVYGGHPGDLPIPQQLQELTASSTRLLNTHVPYTSLPKSITTSSCKIIYIARNPLDTFVSTWYWNSNLWPKLVAETDDELQPLSMEVFFEDYCQGVFPYGPYFNHVLGYWKQSLEQPNKVLFLKYEDLKGGQASVHLKKMAEFVGFLFCSQEESQGVIDDIVEMCSIRNLKELEVNKSGNLNKIFEKKNFFRKGQVGDWTNYFTPCMFERFMLLMQEKLGGTSLSFDLHPHSE